MSETKSSIHSLSLVDKDLNDPFKVPLGRPPRKKIKTLSEEDYIIKLQEIIERDYFPNLENLRDKVEYFKACENHDILKIREIYSKYSDGNIPDLQFPEDSPATFDTPDSHAKKSDSPPLKQQLEETNVLQNRDETTNTDKNESSLSLDAFMTTHTSEDNQSFNQIMEEQKNKFMSKHPWLFEAEAIHNRLYSPNLQMLSIEDQQKHKVLALTGTCDQEKDIRPKNVENWTYKTFNSIMYVPEGAEMSKEKQLELAKVKKREIVYNNTRYAENPFNEELSQAAMLEASAIQAYKKEGKVGIDGKDLKETPKVNGYSYVKMPSPIPGADESPFMTWGQIEGTPFQLDGSETPLVRRGTPQGPSYKIPKVSDRDELLLKLTEKASQNYRDRKSMALSAAKSRLASPGSPFLGKSSTSRLASMSPAARRLLSSKLSSRNADAALRASYTPSPISLRDSIRTPKLDLPKSSFSPLSRARNSKPGVSTPGLTDDLLQLPNRQSERSLISLSRSDEGKAKSTIKEAPLDSSSSLTDDLLQIPKKSSTTPPELLERNQHRPTAADFF